MSTREHKVGKDVKEKDPKRRRTIKAEGRSSSVSTGSPTTSSNSPSSAGTAEVKKFKPETKTAPPMNMFYQEEEQVVNRSLSEDLDYHKRASEELKMAMKDIKTLRAKPLSSKDLIDEKRIHGTLQFVTLKKLNRIAHMRCKKERDSTNEAKQKIDKQHLQLQNLLYEVMHLQKEITKCMEFKSKDEDIDLVPVEEFYNSAPNDISKPDITKADEHQQTLARLDWELQQRKQLSEKLTEAQSMKKELTADIVKKQEYLESLQPKLNAVLTSTKPVQEYLGMPFDKTREQHRAAHYLPCPLYVLYMQATAYHDACGSGW